MTVWRVLLSVSLADLPLNYITGIDASGLERFHTSAHYTKRTDLIIQQLKTTLLVDTAVNAMLDIHMTAARKQRYTGSQVVKRDAGFISVLIGDKEHDDQQLRQLSQNHDIQPIINHWEFILLHNAWNARVDNHLYHRRN